MKIAFRRIYFKGRRVCVRCGDTILEDDKKYSLNLPDHLDPLEVANFIAWYEKNNLSHYRYPYCKKCMAIVKLRGRL